MRGRLQEEILMKRRLSVQSMPDYEAIADYLLGSMDQHEIDLFLPWICHRTRAILNSRWTQVEKIANALLQKQTITHAEILALV